MIASSSASSAVCLPRATYRLQFHRGFTLRQAAELVPYLARLGISHVYASPLLRASPGSTHGYDVCDYARLNPEIGTAVEFAAFVRALHDHQLGLVLDLVPNHMGIASPENRWWWSVLESGPRSPFAAHFDIDWHPPDPRLQEKVLLPVLGERYHQALEQRHLQVRFADDEFTLHYHDHRFPLSPASMQSLLERVGPRNRGNENFGRLGASASATLGSPTPPSDTAAPGSAVTPGSVLAAVEALNADPEALDALLQQQHYRLAYWRLGDTELNYRRFFNITTLAGLRVEDPRAFADAHQCVLAWCAQGFVDGLRVDHPDGLRDPEGYLSRLRAAAPGAWIVVEKILEPGEALPFEWPVQGTTGYDFLGRVGGLFVDSTAEEQLTRFYAEFTGEPVDYAALVRRAKESALQELLAAEVGRLTRLLQEVARGSWRWRDFSEGEWRRALTAVLTCFPVYRTYARAEEGLVRASDGQRIALASRAAREHHPDLPGGLFDLIEELLLLRRRGPSESEFVMRFQQLSGPAMAKGVEDTVFYRFNRLVCLNEVGGDPGHFGGEVSAFHEACRAAQAQWPASMLSTSTHDTKRSEDVRARLGLLSEIPDLWDAAVRRWSALNERHRRNGFPDRNAEYLFYQILVGAWPLPVDRARAYMEKAACEAKQHTSWSRRNAGYDAALTRFVEGVLDNPTFVRDLEAFVAPLVTPGYVTSLAQTLVKLTAPGVPDLYQGTELWDFSLVDPDNRRPVDYALRQRLLAEVLEVSAETAWRRRDEGLAKLFLIQRILAVRARQPGPFGLTSRYAPVKVHGAKARHVVAFVRGGAFLTVVPRLVVGLGEDWADTRIELPAGAWQDELSGEQITAGPELRLSSLLARFPVAWLSRVPPEARREN